MRKKFVITLWVILFLCISAVSLGFLDAIWHGMDWIHAELISIRKIPSLNTRHRPFRPTVNFWVPGRTAGPTVFSWASMTFPLVGQGIGGYGGRAFL